MTVLLGTFGPVATVLRPPAPRGAMEALEIALLVLAGAGAAVVVLTRVPKRQVVMLSLYGLVLSLLFMALQAPDVTLSEITVGSVALPLLLLLALAKMQNGRRPQQGGEGRQRAAQRQDGK